MRYHAIAFSMLACLGISNGHASATDLSKIDRTIAKEPAYKTKPKYCLLVFGPETKHRVWLVLDGDTLYVDRNGNGDLTRPDCRIVGQKDQYLEQYFKVGDLNLGGKRYADLQVSIYSANTIGGSREEMLMFQDFLKARPDGKLYGISIDVPFEKPHPDLRDGSLLTGTRHYVGDHDAGGIFQFASKREDAPVIHFGGRWTIWPDGPQKLVRGRSEDLTLILGTPGHGPGTFARICYDNLIPDSAKPKAKIEFPANAREKALIQTFVLDDRC